ncbi:hypothetical protein Ahy_A01g003078 [Arachis hypogaea]|uniref:Uncharacterized protein n=1 Tax=Arachis hypogaea TaxID=3818 RepID=A0A445ESJ8_ARAHY|nr:hypothetical protein Ahy_A01g003078 [Arachis hypogaea]
MELDANGQGRDNGSNLFVRFLGQKNFEFDYVAGVKWALRTLGDRSKAHKYNLRGEYFFPNKRKAKILAANPSNIPPVEWTTFVDHYIDPKTKKQCLQNAKNHEKLIVSHAGESKSNEKKLGRPVCRSEVIVSTLLKKDGSYVSREGQRLAVNYVNTLLQCDVHLFVGKIAEHLSEDQELATTEGIHLEVLAHLDDAIGKFCGPENVVLVSQSASLEGQYAEVLAVHRNSMLQI